jgi:hypothetical protein
MHEVDEEFDDQREASEPPSFQEYLDLLVRKGRKFPRLFASTEW